MIISHSHSMIFVHIPKNGGTTVETLLKPFLNPEIDMIVSKAAEPAFAEAVAEKSDRFRLRKHMSAPQICNAVLPEIYRSMFSFAFSRNPYSRCYSAYSFLTSRAAMDKRRAAKGLAPSPRPWRQPEVDRSGFLVAEFDQICTDLPKIAATHGLFRPQVHWLPEPDSVTYVGRLETLSQDLHHIYGQIGLPTEGLATIPRTNVKAATGSWRGMSAASAAAIRACYAEDFARFGYDPDFAAPDFAAPELRGPQAAPAPAAPQPTPFS